MAAALSRHASKLWGTAKAEALVAGFPRKTLSACSGGARQQARHPSVGECSSMCGRRCNDRPGRMCVRSDLCRFVRLSKGQPRVLITEFQNMVELGGNPFIPLLFRTFDTNGDNSLSLEEFTRALEALGSLDAEDEQYKCRWPACRFTNMHAHIAAAHANAWLFRCTTPHAHQ